MSDLEEEEEPRLQRQLKEFSEELDQGLFNLRDGQVSVDYILAQCNGEYSSSNPLKVTILAPTDWGGLLMIKELVIQLAKFPQLKVTVLVPENSEFGEQDKREAQSQYKLTIVEAKKQPGFVDPIEWLNFPPADLSTDIVVGYGEELGRVAQYWKERYQCKSMHIVDCDNIWWHDPLPTIKNLCQVADIPVAIGPKSADAMSASLTHDRKKVFNLTPGIISEFDNLTHSDTDREKFRVLLVGGDDPVNFQREGLDIAAKAVTEINDKSCHLIYVGAGEGNEQFAHKFYECGVSKAQLEIRSLPKDDVEWKRLFCEVDLAIMPSGEKAFGLDALLALSAGLPVLVHGDSGFGEALKAVKFGHLAIVDSENAAVWASEIKKVRETDRKQRLEQAAELRSQYDKRYNWEKQCRAVVGIMLETCSVCANDILAQCNGKYSSSNPLKVTILATGWRGWAGSLFIRELSKQLAKFPQLKVTIILVPENSGLSDQDKREEQSQYKITIVEAKKQPGFVDPIEWLNFPPADLSTDIVVGYGEKLGKIAQYWKEQNQCKTIQLFSDHFNSRFFIDEDPFESFSEKTRKGLCEVADICVATGPKMSEKLSASLCQQKKRFLNLTPGIISEFCDTKHRSRDGGKFRVLLVGGDNPDKFQEEGLEIAAKAVRELNDKSYHLIYVGAGKETKQQFSKLFQQCGVAKRQLTIKGFPNVEWKSLFFEVDLAIMPSGENEFGLEALFALSAGLPFLVHGESGFGEALKKVTFGTSAIVDSDDATEWATEIKRLKETDRKTRLKEAADLRSNYDKMYSWEKQCGALVGVTFMMVSAQENPEASQVNGQPS